jgi:cell division protein FtsW
MLGALFGLMIIGAVMIYSTTSYTTDLNNQSQFLKKQLIAEVLGLGVIGFIYLMPYEFIRLFGARHVRMFVLLGSLLTVFLLKTPLGKTVNGATRWIVIGPLQVQPAEIVKIAILVYIAGFIAEKKDFINTKTGFFHALAVTGLSAALVYKISNNLSSALIIGGIGVLMIFASTKDWVRQVIGYGIIITLGIWFMISKAHSAQAAGEVDTLKFRYKRILIWEDPTNPDFYYEGAFQTLQGLYAIGSGGVFGKGIGKGIQKLDKIPEVHNDMIYSAICEEIGLLGAAVVLVLLGTMVLRCFQLALRARDTYGMLLCTGVMLHIAIQTILNVMVVTNTMPNTGVSLPFISYGGSSALFLMAEVGLVLRVARNSSR